MKYYESHYEDYIHSVEKFNLHNEMNRVYNKFPNKISQLENLIFFGASGVGKYSQILYLLKKYSPSELKYDKKITIQTEKQDYIYKISDIHYEVDMSLLGCNSKLVWHEVFFQIVDIISVKADKIGIIICKNFHLIHTELLEIFYSYMQQYNHSHSTIKIKFFIVTEHISFIPKQIINACQVIKMARPSKDRYFQTLTLGRFSTNIETNHQEPRTFLKKITDYKGNHINVQNTKDILDKIDTEGILNTKELNSFSNIESINDLPKDVFNIICDNIIKEILKTSKLSFTDFRDTLYDILTYNLDVTECLWYILRFFIQNDYLNEKDTSDILKKTYTFLKYYNNNYRPIYHLESIMFYIINKIHNYNEL